MSKQQSTTEKLTEAMAGKASPEQGQGAGAEPMPAEPAPTVSAAEEVKGLEHPSYVDLEARLTEAEAKTNDYWNQLLRSRAEQENLMRRVERDIAGAHKFALEKFAAELLPVLDSLERALAIPVEGDGLLKQIHEGIALTHSLFLKSIEKFGIRQIHPLGEAFDPAKHQAISTAAAAGTPPNTVVEVMQKGYSLNERLIRPALVVVSA